MRVICKLKIVVMNEFYLNREGTLSTDLSNSYNFERFIFHFRPANSYWRGQPIRGRIRSGERQCLSLCRDSGWPASWWIWWRRRPPWPCPPLSAPELAVSHASFTHTAPVGLARPPRRPLAINSSLQSGPERCHKSSQQQSLNVQWLIGAKKYTTTIASYFLSICFFSSLLGFM